MQSFDAFAKRIIFPTLVAALLVATYFTFVGDDTVDLDFEIGSAQTGRYAETQQAPITGSMNTSGVSVGARYQTLTEIDNAQRLAGFVRVGLFGNHWPARIVEVHGEDDGIRFVRGNGTAHTYTKYEGYHMQMVRLRQGDNETLLVYRSMAKRE